jgi:hypothetical protein
MIDKFIPYIKFDPTFFISYNQIEIESFPFPADHMPEVFNLRIFLIEKNQLGYFLRSSINSLFCCALYEVVKDIEVPAWDSDQMSYKYHENGEVIYKTERLQYLSFTIEGQERVVAYNYAGKSKNFLRIDKSEIPFTELDEKLQKLYKGAKLLSWQYVEHYENEIRHLDLKNRGLKPKGEWEAQMFRDVFNSNPSTMNDDEYEMIFGVAR